MNELMQKAKENAIRNGYQHQANLEELKLWGKGKELTEGNPLTIEERIKYHEELIKDYQKYRLSPNKV